MRRSSTIAAALLALLLAAGAAWTHRLSALAERDFPPEGRFVEVEGLRLHVVDRGLGPPVVLLHGAYGAVQDWTATIADELARTHRVLVFDRPGHGWSERPSGCACGPLEQARILRSALRELGVERPLLVGFSWSGTLALSWALAWPDELAGVLLVNGVAYSWPAPSNIEYVAAGLPVIGPLLAYTVAAPLGTWTTDAAVRRAFGPASVPATFARSPIALALRPKQFLVEAQDMRLLKAAAAIQCSRYPEIRVPLSMLAAREDVVAPWEFHSGRLHAAVPGSELVVLEGAGHQILHSHPAEVLAAIERASARAKRAE
jgi:pimeloyl-ACP methyl ester carboxylesterase